MLLSVDNIFAFKFFLEYPPAPVNGRFYRSHRHLQYFCNLDVFLPPYEGQYRNPSVAFVETEHDTLDFLSQFPVLEHRVGRFFSVLDDEGFPSDIVRVVGYPDRLDAPRVLSVGVYDAVGCDGVYPSVQFGQFRVVGVQFLIDLDKGVIGYFFGNLGSFYLSRNVVVNLAVKGSINRIEVRYSVFSRFHFQCV